MKEFVSIEILKEILKTLWKNSRNIRFRVISCFLLIFIISILNLCVPWTFKNILDKLSDRFIYEEFTLVFILYGSVWFLASFSQKLKEFIAYQAFERTVSKFNTKTFRALLYSTINFHTSNHTGGIMNAIEISQRSVPIILYGVFFSVLPMLLELLLVGSLIAIYYGIFFTGLLMFFPLGYIVYSMFTARWLVKAQRKSVSQKKRFSSFINDTLLNIEGIHYQSAQKEFLSKSKYIFRSNENYLARNFEISAIIAMGQSIIAGIGITIMTLVTGAQVYANKFNLGDFVLFNAYLLQFIAPLNAISMMYREILDSLTKLESMFSIFQNKQIYSHKTKLQELNRDNYNVQFKDVEFRYSMQHKRVIKNITFHIPINSFCALVGENGSGKSTIIKLLFGMYKASKGKIFVGDCLINSLNLDSLRKNVAVVPQNNFLLDDTIYANLTIGNKGHYTSDQFNNIMESTGLADLVKLMPKGYETKVGERGLRLSGGQKQLIGIARALLRNPKILILDEATSALDNLVEQKIYSYIKKMNKITKLIITHKTQNLNILDKVLFISHGELIAEGSHHKLCKNNSLYKNFVKKYRL